MLSVGVPRQPDQGVVRSRPAAVGASAQVLILPAFLGRLIAGCGTDIPGPNSCASSGHAKCLAGALRVIRETSAVTEEATEFKYRAFIAFNKADTSWADDIQRALESVRIPAQFVGSETPYGPAPENLRPIFRCGDALPEGQGGFDRRRGRRARRTRCFSSFCVLPTAPRASTSTPPCAASNWRASAIGSSRSSSTASRRAKNASAFR